MGEIIENMTADKVLILGQNLVREYRLEDAKREWTSRTVANFQNLLAAYDLAKKNCRNATVTGRNLRRVEKAEKRRKRNRMARKRAKGQIK